VYIAYKYAYLVYVVYVYLVQLVVNGWVVFSCVTTLYHGCPQLKGVVREKLFSVKHFKSQDVLAKQ